jgi:activating signal cointegrator 1
MKIISLWQPWASAMAWLWKRNETRSWSTKHRGEVAIHAAKQNGTSYLDIREYAVRKLVEAGAPVPSPFPEMPRGAIVAVGELVDVLPVAEFLRLHKPSALELAFGDYGPMRSIWVFSNVRAVVPLPYKASQGLRDLPEEVASQVSYLKVA